MKIEGDQKAGPATLSAVVACFNEEGTIATLLGRVMSADTLGLKLDIIVVDDGSSDRSREIVEQVARQDSRVRLLKHERNRGKGATLHTGIAAATSDVVLIQDADLEYARRSIQGCCDPSSTI